MTQQLLDTWQAWLYMIIGASLAGTALELLIPGEEAILDVTAAGDSLLDPFHLPSHPEESEVRHALDRAHAVVTLIQERLPLEAHP
jgi:hypothetical protein